MIWSSVLMVASAIAASAAQAKPDSSLPLFRATDVRVVHDTVWFYSTRPAEGVTRHPMIGFIPATGAWITVLRRWRDVDAVNDVHLRSGPVVARFEDEQRVGAGYRIADTRHGYEQSLPPRFTITTAAGWRTPLRFDIAPAERRRLYRAGGGHLSGRSAAPGFGRTPTRWAAAAGRLALAFPGDSPPHPIEPVNYTPPEDERRYRPVLSGILVVDSAAQHLVPLTAPSLIERGWVGLEFVGKDIFVAPTLIDDGVSYAHAAARSRAPRLARYTPATKRWVLFYDADLPTGDSPVADIAADGERLYIATTNGAAVFDARTNTWQSRFYADTTFLLTDGADTTVTRLVARRPAPVPPCDEDTDSTCAINAFVARLGPRHLTAFKETLLRLVPVSLVSDVGSYILMMDRRADELGDIEPPFGSMSDTVAVELSRPEFVPYLREMMWKSETKSFAALALARLGEPYLLSALHATLDSGSIVAALWAADTLSTRGDSLGLAWLRRRIAPPLPSLDFEPEQGLAYQWPLGGIVNALAARNDTASLTNMIALLRAPDGKLASRGQERLVEALIAFPSLGAQRRIAHAVEERPWLWPGYLSAMHQWGGAFLADAEIQATLSRLK